MGKQKETKVKLVLAIVSLIVALFLAELFVFFLDTRFARTRENMARQNGIPLVVLIGDSFAQGACVGPGEDVAGQLRKMGINALNLGMGGNGPLIELALMKEYVELLKPEFVLWMYFEGNDLRELNKEKASFFARYYFDSDFSQNLIYRQAEIDQALLEFIQRYKQKEIAREQEEKRRQKRKWRAVIGLKAIRARLLQVIAQSSLLEHAAPPNPMFEEILAKAQQ